MLDCAYDHVQSCNGSTDALAYLFEVLRRNSLCYKRKRISEIIENVSDDDVVEDQ